MKEPAVDRRATLLVLGVTALLVPALFAAPEPDPEELKANREQLEQWRKDPAQMGRLRRDLAVFLALPENRREQLLKFDADLREHPASSRLFDVLTRYAAWIERLPEADREAIRSAPDRGARLKIIRELRDQQWMRMQPRAVQSRWQRLVDKERVDLLQTLRKDARDRRGEWQLAVRFWKELDSGRPVLVRLTDLELDDRVGVIEYLMPVLTLAEKKRLNGMEGQWPEFMQTLVELADRHPLALLGPIKHFKDLPKEVRDRLSPPTNTKGIVTQPTPIIFKQVENQWPAFAHKAIEQYNKRAFGPLPNELWAENSKCLLPPMRDYLTRVLRPALEPTEQQQLAVAEGSWPAYPNKIQELAVKYLLPPPWQTALLGGPAERWDSYRVGNLADVPLVPRQALLDFKNRLTEQQRERLNAKLTPNDLMQNWKIWQEAFFKQMPNEQHKLFPADPRKFGPRPPFMPHPH
jgi:hypothetical protein